MCRLVRDPTIQCIIINVHTKYDYSSLHGFTANIDKKFHYSKYEKEENWTNTEKNKQKKAGWFAIPRCSTSLPICIPNITTLACAVLQKSLTKNFITHRRERK